MAKRLMRLLKLTFGGTIEKRCEVIPLARSAAAAAAAAVAADADAPAVAVAAASNDARLFLTIATGGRSEAIAAAAAQPLPRCSASRGPSSPCGVYHTREKRSPLKGRVQCSSRHPSNSRGL